MPGLNIKHNKAYKNQGLEVTSSPDLVRDDVMNEHLAERFKGNRHRPEADSNTASQSRARLDNSVQQYLQRDLPSRASFPWCRLPELPTSTEILTPVDSTFGSHRSTDNSQALSSSDGGAIGIEQESEWNNTTKHDSGRRQNEEHDFQLKSSEFNNIDGPWSSKEDFLQTHYKLIRADALFSLRQAVAQVTRFPTLCETQEHANWSFYDKVFIAGITPTQRGTGVRVQFSLDRVGKQIEWRQSKRLLSGSLVVLLSYPDLAECRIAVVATRPVELLEKPTPEIDLFFARPDELEIDCRKEWIMIEDRSGFYEAERHTMLALQRMMDEEFPLKEHLVDVERDVEPAAHVVEDPQRDISAVCPSADRLPKVVDILRAWPKESGSTLDNTQMEALQRVLGKSLALIQGPPGTGKTYISVQGLRIMLEHHSEGDPPIVIACQTNHALDQLLCHVKEFEPEFVRLGSRSADAEVKKRTLFETRRAETGQFPRSRMLAIARKNIEGLSRQTMKLLQPLTPGEAFLDPELLRDYAIISQKQYDSLIRNATGWVTGSTDGSQPNVFEIWLGDQLEKVHGPGGYKLFDDFELERDVEVLRELEAEQMAGDEEDDRLDPKFFIPLKDTYDGKSSAIASDILKHLLKTRDDIGKIPPKLRGPLYRYLLRQLKDKVLPSFRELAGKLTKEIENRKMGRWEEDSSILRRRKVIGVTTTGFSKYRALISSLKPKIVLIEEAAETLEAPIIAACVESVEQLILVGDHKQLRPQCHFKQLEEYSLNISLFERLVNNGVEYSILQRQRRMIPAIRELLRPIYGDAIGDHPSVSDPAVRPPITGMQGPLWFVDHEFGEQRDDQMSCYNMLEAEMIVQLVRHLIANGMPAEQITILTFYNGQRRKLLRLIRDVIWSEKPLKIATVDSYQGEENGVVILSLVRNNFSGNIGFLNVDNRVCVALSRAQRGFYIFGNAQLLANNSGTWREVIDILEIGTHGNGKNIGSGIPIRCQRHGRTILIDMPADFAALDGGCDWQCADELDCGHKCQKKCHPADQHGRCRQICGKPLPCGHDCRRECNDICKCSSCTDDSSTSSKSSQTSSKFSRVFGAAAPRAKSSNIAGQDNHNQRRQLTSRSTSNIPTAVTQHHRRSSSRSESQEGWHRFANGGVQQTDRALAEAVVRQEEQAFFEQNAEVLFNVKSTAENPRTTVRAGDDGRTLWRHEHGVKAVVQDRKLKVEIPNLLDYIEGVDGVDMLEVRTSQKGK